MKKIKSMPATNNQGSIVCGHCGSETHHNQSIFTKLPEPIVEASFVGFKTENQIVERQKYLTHIFEAQKRFGE